MLIEPKFIFGRHIFRYHATLLRARFDQNKNMTDLSKARALVVAGERENFEKTHPIPKKCKFAVPLQWQQKWFFAFLIVQLLTVPEDVHSIVRLFLPIGFWTTGIRWRRHSIRNTLHAVSNGRRNMSFGGRKCMENINRANIIRLLPWNLIKNVVTFNPIIRLGIQFTQENVFNLRSTMI